jgi:hypothetical protein
MPVEGRGEMTGAACIPPLNGHARWWHGVASFKSVRTLHLGDKNVFGAISHDRDSHYYTFLFTFLERLPFATIALLCKPDRIVH